ncbi:MAG: serine/threonine-protein kinase, partial [Gemmatimonadaceae bacterium]
LGIVHRDLKPENVLVGAHPDGRERVKIVDFGISKAPRAEGQTVTRTGQIIGTPDYMSPEQLAGEVVDPRSDVYSLAIVAFTMLTGRLPFESNSAQTAMLLRLTERPARLTEARPDVPWPAEMQTALDRAMALEPAQRTESALAFSGAFSRAAAHLPSIAPSDATTIIAGPSVHAGQTRVARAPTATPLDLSFPVASGLSPVELADIKTKLAKVVGPIAGVLVKRAAASAPPRDAFIDALAREIDDAGERERFRQSVR